MTKHGPQLLPFQTVHFNPHRLLLGSAYSSGCPAQAIWGGQYYLPRQGLLILESETILQHPLIGLPKVYFSFFPTAYATSKWHLNCSWNLATRLEWTVFLMVTLQMAFQSWLINAVNAAFSLKWRSVTLFGSNAWYNTGFPLGVFKGKNCPWQNTKEDFSYFVYVNSVKRHLLTMITLLLSNSFLRGPLQSLSFPDSPFIPSHSSRYPQTTSLSLSKTK